jgi:hypothetical protein
LYYFPSIIQVAKYRKDAVRALEGINAYRVFVGKVKVKVKVALQQAMKAQRKSRGIALHFL